MVAGSDRSELIGKVRNLPSLVEEAISGLSDEQLDTPYGEGKWTVRQVVHHLADSHANANLRFKLTLTEERPTLTIYNQDKWARLGEMHLPLEASLSIIRGLHCRWATLLETLREEDWQRAAHHPVNGEYTFEKLVNVYANHGETHVKQITDLRRRMGW